MKILVVLSFVVLVMLCTGVIGDPDQCVFPFTYDDKTYNKCTYAGYSVPWCAYDHEYQRSRWDVCECREEDKRECAEQRGLCLPAGDDKPQQCILLPHYAGLGRR